MGRQLAGDEQEPLPLNNGITVACFQILGKEPSKSEWWYTILSGYTMYLPMISNNLNEILSGLLLELGHDCRAAAMSVGAQLKDASVACATPAV